MKNRYQNEYKQSLSLTIPILIMFLIPTFSLFSEEYSIRKKKNPKKVENNKKNTVSEPGSGFSRENNRISNLYWMEESALFIPDSTEIEPTENPVVNPPPVVEKQESPLPTKPQEEVTGKPPLQEKEKQNVIWQFLMENKKILLIVSLIIIFAIYRLRGNTPTYSGQGRIFSKFRNK